MSSINIMWVDDESDKPLWIDFIESCEEKYGMMIHCYKTAKEGIDALHHHEKFWDAIILDVKGFYENTTEEPSRKGFSKIKNELIAMKYKRDIPYFIFTGDPQIDEKTFAEENGKFYIKGSGLHERGQNEMLEDIYSTVKDSENVLLKTRYSQLFDSLSIEIEDEMLSILKILNNNEANTDVFVKIRKVLEWIMRQLAEYGLLGKPFNGTNLAECSRFLGTNSMSQFIPFYIQRSFHACVYAANQGSHRQIIDEDVKTGKAPFVIHSTIYELMNILYWFINLPKDENSCIEMKQVARNAL